MAKLTNAFVRAPLAALETEVCSVLHPAELEKLAALKFDRRRLSFLLGRFAAKAALRCWVGQGQPTDWEIASGVFGQPLVRGPHAADLTVSLAHAQESGAALVTERGHPVGVDFETVAIERIEALRSQVVPEEVVLAKALVPEEIEYLTLLWTAKEALSKATGTGMMTPFPLMSLETLKQERGWLISEFKNFGQYRAWSVRLSDVWLSVVLPKKTELTCDTAWLCQSLRQ
jgi:phosphopantetheinyl transferase